MSDENELPSDPEKEALLILTPVGRDGDLIYVYRYTEVDYIEIGQPLETGEEVSGRTDYYREMAKRHGCSFNVQTRPIQERGQQLEMGESKEFEDEADSIILGDSEQEIPDEEIILP